jgi:predicted ATPase
VATTYDKTEHYSLTREFLEEPERFYRFLLADDD